MHALLLWIVACLWAGTANASPATLMLAISEGTSGAQDSSEVLLKYEEFAAFIGRTLNRKVNLVLARDFPRLEEGMKRGVYHLVMARPSDYPARGVRDYGYRLVVTTKGDGHAVFIVRGDSPLKQIGDVRGREIALPEQVAYMARVATATLRDAGVDVKREKASFHRDQAVIGYAVEMGLSDVGAVASYSSVARDWEKKGGRVLARGPGKPYMPLVAAPSLSADEVGRLREALVGLSRSDEGRAILSKLKVPGFEARAPEELIALLEWIGY